MSSARAILQRERSEISPVLSKRFIDPRLTPDRSASFCWLILRRRRIARTFPAIVLSISFGDSVRRYKLFIDNIIA